MKIRTKIIQNTFSLFFLVGLLIFSTQSVEGLDKFKLCGALNITNQDCDDFWNNLTSNEVTNNFYNITNTTQSPFNASNFYSKGQLDTRFSNLTTTISGIVRAEDLTSAEKEELIRLRLEKEFQNKTTGEIALAIADKYPTKDWVNSQLLDLKSAIEKEQVADQSTRSSNNTNWTPWIIVLAVVAILVYLYFNHQKKQPTEHKGSVIYPEEKDPIPPVDSSQPQDDENYTK